MLTLEKFERASELVKRGNYTDEAGIQRIPEHTDRGQGLSETREYAVYRRL